MTVRANETAVSAAPDQQDVDQAASEAARAATALAAADPATLAAALRLIANRLDEAGPTLVPVAIAETKLGQARLAGELVRTTFQLRLFAQLLADGSSHGVVIDHADETWPLGARPDLRRCLVPLGPVAVFAASNSRSPSAWPAVTQLPRWRPAARSS